jgi:fructose-1,6-bisphosphatase/inositol monophosphatase family enzyme
MVGVDYDGTKPVIGCVHFPGLNEGIYAASGRGAWWYGSNASPKRAAVSKTTELDDCVLVTSELEAFEKRGASSVYTALSRSVFFARTWGDVYGYLLVATGRVEIMIDPILNIWDAAAVQPILEEAGGTFTDWAGVPRINGGEAIGTNGLIHDSVLEFTRGFSGQFACSEVKADGPHPGGPELEA